MDQSDVEQAVRAWFDSVRESGSAGAARRSPECLSFAQVFEAARKLAGPGGRPGLEPAREAHARSCRWCGLAVRRAALLEMATSQEVSVAAATPGAAEKRDDEDELRF